MVNHYFPHESVRLKNPVNINNTFTFYLVYFPLLCCNSAYLFSPKRVPSM